MVMIDKKALLIFAKSPIPGRVKTRLSPPLTPEDATELYRCLLFDTILLTGDIKGIDRFLISYPSKRERFFQDISRRYDIEVLDQIGRDLGERMKNAMDHLFSIGYERVIIIGSDSPTIPIQYIEDAFLDLMEKEIVIGPSYDGGYYLIGSSERTPLIFDDIPWGGDRVMESTMEKIDGMNFTYSILPPWYDIDDIKDLYLLIKDFTNRPKERDIPSHTIDFIVRHPGLPFTFHHPLPEPCELSTHYYRPK